LPPSSSTQDPSRTCQPTAFSNGVETWPGGGPGVASGEAPSASLVPVHPDPLAVLLQLGGVELAGREELQDRLSVQRVVHLVAGCGVDVVRVVRPHRQLHDAGLEPGVGHAVRGVDLQPDGDLGVDAQGGVVGGADAAGRRAGSVASDGGQEQRRRDRQHRGRGGRADDGGDPPATPQLHGAGADVGQHPGGVRRLLGPGFEHRSQVLDVGAHD
jgi:hypothetical protein